MNTRLANSAAQTNDHRDDNDVDRQQGSHEQVRNRSALVLSEVRRAISAARLRKYAAPAFAWAGFAIALIGLSFDGQTSLVAPFIAKAMLGSGTLLMAVALTVSAVSSGQVCDSLRIEKITQLGDRIEKRIEDLEDIRWQMRDSSERMRSLLDAQEDVILRYDAHGRLSFVNRAFTIQFGKSPDDVLNTQFQISALDCQIDESPVTIPPEPFMPTAWDGLDENCEIIAAQTVSGRRWFCWRHSRIPSADGLSFDRLAIGQDVSDQVRHEAELATARDQAEAANRAKSRFLASMSHEIRTPMNGILGMGGLLLETSLSPEQQTYAAAMDQSARTLLTLIDEILDFSKIEAGHLVLTEASFSPIDCVQGVVELLAPRAFDKDLELAWSVDCDAPGRLLGDQVRVRQILLNLIGNAVKFTDRGGVLVSVETATIADRKCRLTISVVDTGEGLSPDKINKIFTEFERADADMLGRESGTGLGLAIAQRLARAMSGDIIVESELGRGATFKVVLELPIAEPGSVKSASQAWFGNSAVGDRCTALLAFDRIIERRALARMLRQRGVRTLETSDVSDEALIREILERDTKIDLLIVDAEDDPFEAGRLLSRLQVTIPEQTINAVALVNPAIKDSLPRFRAAGFTGHLTRPVRPRSLIARLCDTDETIGRIAHSHNNSILPVKQRQAGTDVAGPRILLAEDNDINALLATTMLKRYGCPVVRARNGVEAVRSVIQSIENGLPFDLVMMDLHMPELDGIAATSRIYEFCRDRGTAAPRIIAVTANAFPEDRKRCLAAGLDDYLSKPFDRAELSELLERCGFANLKLAPVDG